LSSTVSCSHCHLDFSPSVMIKENGNYFCCKGCQGVYHLLSDEGLDSFYDKSGNTKLSPPKDQYEDSSNYNSDAFYSKFVKETSDGLSEISLIVEGMHCSACIWLNEKVLHILDGVIEVNINFTNNKAHVVWLDERVKLSKIIDTIRSVGYNAYPYDTSIQEIKVNKERKNYYLKMSVAIFASMNIMWIAVAQYAGYFTGIDQDIKNTLNITEGILATPVLFYSGWVFFRGAYYGLKNKVLNMDFLVATGALLTYIYSIYITITEHGEAYFDSVSMIITFILIGKFLEVLSKKNAADSLDMLCEHLASEVKVFKNSKSSFIKLEEVHVGDTIVISSGEKLLIDGEILKGEGFFDESSLTGESEPIYKSKGEKVISGTLSIDADIHYAATKNFKDSTLSTIVSLLENAINKKPKIEQLANKLSQHFSSVILFLSLLTFISWLLLDYGFEESLMVGISVIIIACPCALGLATPVATLVGINLGAKKGILFKEAAHIETMAKANVLVIDKTGTLTIGKPEVVQEKIYREFDKSLLFSLVKGSNHPISKGITKYIGILDENVLSTFKQIPGKGILAEHNGNLLLGGNKDLMNEYNIECEHENENSIFYFAINKEVVATYELQDKIRQGASELIQHLNKQNIETIMLTGDHKKSAYNVAKKIGIQNVNYSLSPKDKLEFINELHRNDKVVVMVGDGVNDILALAKSDIGISMGSGSDIAVQVSDIVLLNDTLISLDDAFKISHTTFNLIKQNFALSFLYNAITIPLAMGGFIIPLIAALSMSASSLLVVGNSLRIKYKWTRS
jgi:P-type Cu+ transporter